MSCNDQNSIISICIVFVQINVKIVETFLHIKQEQKMITVHSSNIYTSLIHCITHYNKQHCLWTNVCLCKNNQMIRFIGCLSMMTALYVINARIYLFSLKKKISLDGSLKMHYYQTKKNKTPVFSPIWSFANSHPLPNSPHHTTTTNQGGWK